MRNSRYIYNQTNDLGCWRENNVTAHKKPENAPRCLYKYYFVQRCTFKPARPGVIKIKTFNI